MSRPTRGDPGEGDRRDHWLGIDAGATHTAFVVLDAAHVACWRGDAGPIDHLAGVAGEIRMRTTLGQIVASVPLALRALIGHVAVGLSGLSIPGKADLCRSILRSSLPQARTQVTSDLVAALWGCTGGQDGVILLCGTGSAALGLRAGVELRAGGYGSQFSDEGSAYDIAVGGIRAAIRAAEDRGPPTKLVTALAQAAEVDHIHALAGAAFAQGWDAARVAGLARVVARAAEDGDAVAGTILRRAGRELAELAATVLRKSGPAVPVYLVGRGWRLSRILERTVEERLRSQGTSNAVIRAADGCGALGAVLWAEANRSGDCAVD